MKIIKNISKLLFFLLLTGLFNNINISILNAAPPNIGDENAIVTVLCNIVKLLTGSIAKAVAIIAIVVVAVGLFMGKFSWGVGLATAIGISMIFGASSVVGWLAKGISTVDQGLLNAQNLC